MHKLTLSLLFSIAFFVLAPDFVAAQNDDEAKKELRGLLAQIGLGIAYPQYPSWVESELTYLDSIPGVDRTKLSLDLELGFPIEWNLYIMAGIIGSADRITGPGGWMQINLYLYALGLRGYLGGLYAEALAGSSSAVIDTSWGSYASSTSSFGYGGTLGYDFFPKHRGVSLSLEARYNVFNIEGTAVGDFMFLLNLLYK